MWTPDQGIQWTLMNVKDHLCCLYDQNWNEHTQSTSQVTEQAAWLLCVSSQPKKLWQALGLLWVTSVNAISFCHRSSNEGENPVEVRKSWHRMLRWICWHCCGLLCKYSSVDFVKHKLCKHPFIDFSKCRLLAWCLETIIKISNVNLYSGLLCKSGQPVDV